jgi:nitrogen fixation/metabolism regulation signal transduction histidine kinase
MTTCYAPAGREPAETLTRQASVVAAAPLVNEMLDAMPSMVMVLNQRRQIVAANAALLGALDTTVALVLGRRHGEAVFCCHAADGPDGCGTGSHCVACGAVHAVLECQQTGGKIVRECRILSETPDGVCPRELRVTATPIAIGGERLLVVVIDDISREKRLAVLQRAFFHDVLNTAGCLEGYARYLADDRSASDEIVDRLGALAEQLVEEIRGHRDLVLAESGDLEVSPEPVQTATILAEIRAQWVRHPAAERRAVVLRRVWQGTIQTDPRLLMRVLGNMLRNALEATDLGGAATIECLDEDDKVLFTVHNREVMPPN